MDRETMLAELNRLLDAGEPLLTLFPDYPQNSWALQLPDNISSAMRWYVEDVAFRAWDREGFKDLYQQETTGYFDWLIERRKVGLLGWRAIGVLK